MRKFVAVIAIASAALALPACSGERFSGAPSAGSSASNSYTYEPPGSIARAPLSAPPGYATQPGYGSSYGSPQGYGSPPPPADPSPPPYGNLQGYGSQTYGGAPDAAAAGGWRASPRWSAVQGDGCIEVEQGGNASRDGDVTIETCSNSAPEIGEGTPAGLLPPAAY